MADQQAPPPLPKSQPSFGKRHSTIIKLLGVAKNREEPRITRMSADQKKMTCEIHVIRG